LKSDQLRIAMFSIHSSPIGELGTKNTGGMSVYIRELARHLGVFGHRVDIYTKLNGSKHNQIIELYDNVRLIHFITICLIFSEHSKDLNIRKACITT
jgi:D-inositol-3-phosphate glycosyltransferase